jgi:hypothetical protein
MKQHAIICSISIYNNKNLYKQSIENIVLNATKNNINFYREFQGPIANSEYIYDLLQKNNQCILYAETLNYPFELYIKPSELKITPLNPIKTKTGIDCPKEAIDLHFYTEIMLKLVDDFAIYELHSEAHTKKIN